MREAASPSARSGDARYLARARADPGRSAEVTPGHRGERDHEPVDAVQLKAALDSHTEQLRERGFNVHDAVVEPPATAAEVSEVEELVGMPLPPSFRQTLEATSRAVRWSWFRPDTGESLSAPFREIFSGSFEWSIETLPDAHKGYLGWVEHCFPDPDDPYDVVWHDKLGFASAPNGDVLAVDLAPERLGSIVYLSHDDGESHGFLMAHSLADLVDRGAPLACPGPEDWQWLPFVPYDTGPIDPACANAAAWRSLMGLTAASPQTPATGPDDELFVSLLASYYGAPNRVQMRRVALRALRICSTDRVDDVLGLLDSEDQFVQEAAAERLGAWGWEPAVAQLKRVALEGTHNGRISGNGRATTDARARCPTCSRRTQGHVGQGVVSLPVRLIHGEAAVVVVHHKRLARYLALAWCRSGAVRDGVAGPG